MLSQDQARSLPLTLTRCQCQSLTGARTFSRGTPEPLMSHLQRHSVVAPSVMGGLQAEVRDMLHQILVLRPHRMELVAPMGNFPRPAICYNTKLSRQHSRPGLSAHLEPQGQARLCRGCWDGVGSNRGAQCSSGGSTCAGCDRCLGRMFCCPACGTQFEMRRVYESGSGLSSIGRAADQFEVHRFTSYMERAAAQLERHHGLAHQLQSCVMVGYLGSDFCASCALQIPHGSKRCGTTLNAHRDRGGGGNSQESTPNFTLSFGATRTLSMELRLPPRCSARGGGSHYSRGVGPEAAAEFELDHGSEFVLEPQDEELRPRSVGDGTTAMGSFYHGMLTEVAPNAVSCGLVFRAVGASAEVDVATNLVILSRNERAQLHARLPKGYNNKPEWAEGFKGSQAEALKLARDWWSSRAAEYSNVMSARLQAALASWPTAPLTPPQVVVCVLQVTTS